MQKPIKKVSSFSLEVRQSWYHVALCPPSFVSFYINLSEIKNLMYAESFVIHFYNFAVFFVYVMERDKSVVKVWAIKADAKWS